MLTETARKQKMPTVEFNGQTVQRMQEALYSAFSAKNRLDQMVTAVLGAALNTFSDTAQDVPSIIFDLCREAKRLGKLEKLLKGAHLANPGNPDLAKLHQELFGSMVTGAAPVKLYERCLLNQDVVLFDRQPLREELEGIDNHQIRRILVVTGKEKSGKSYTDQLIRLEAKENQYKTITLKLRGLPKTDPVKALAVSIAGQMKPESFAASPPEQGTESDVRWAFHPLMTWTLAWVRQAPGTWWFIIDEFEKDLVDPTVYAFLVDLAVKIEEDVPTCRLALLGFDQPIPPEWTQKHRHEDIETIEKKHLEDFFNGLYRQMGLEPDTATSKDLAQEFFDKYQAHKATRAAKLAANPALTAEDDPEVAPARQFLNEQLSHYAGKRLAPGA